MYTVGIIGLGLIGGSMGLDLKARGYAGAVLGVEAGKAAGAAALQMGLADEIVPLEECLERSDMVILSVPVGVAVQLLPEVLDFFAAHPSKPRTVMDVCSTKRNIVEAVSAHPMRGRYVASHPMAGTEYSGPWAAVSGLFDSHACIFCDCSQSDADALDMVSALYDTLNMRVIRMDASQHDVHTAYVSHISHITSFALALTVLDKEKDEKHIFDLASGGFSSTVRLAKSNADMWVPIMTQNKENILHVLDTYLDKMTAFRDAIASDDSQAIRDLISQANKIKRILK